MTRENNEESVFSRWSRRKVDARAGKPLDEPEALKVEVAAEIEEQPLAKAEENEAPVLTDEDMPDLDTLTHDSDLSMFMSKGVSDKLRNLALRKMFSAPSFTIRDGLDEYDEDYTSFEKLGDIVTCDMKHQAEMQEKKRLEKLAEEQARLEAEQDSQLDSEEAESSTELEAAAESEPDVDSANEESIEEENHSDRLTSLESGHTVSTKN